MYLLGGKNALVTGAGTNGIGKAIALNFAKAGANIAIHALEDNDTVRDLQRDVRQCSVNAEVFVASFCDTDAARKTVRDVVAAFGCVDILVNNAATMLRTPAIEMGDEEFLELIQVNLLSQFACAQEAARDMRNRNSSGRIIFISSVLQELAMIGQCGYSASKGGAMQMAKVLALELAETGVTVNLIAPGTIETDINRDLLADPDLREQRLKLVPMKRFGTPADIANAALFLASDQSSYITGATITVDGGLCLP